MATSTASELLLEGLAFLGFKVEVEASAQNPLNDGCAAVGADPVQNPACHSRSNPRHATGNCPSCQRRRTRASTLNSGTPKASRPASTRFAAHQPPPRGYATIPRSIHPLSPSMETAPVTGSVLDHRPVGQFIDGSRTQTGASRGWRPPRFHFESFGVADTGRMSGRDGGASRNFARNQCR
jgi:hypothetical protein